MMAQGVVITKAVLYPVNCKDVINCVEVQGVRTTTHLSSPSHTELIK